MNQVRQGTALITLLLGLLAAGISVDFMCGLGPAADWALLPVTAQA